MANITSTHYETRTQCLQLIIDREQAVILAYALKDFSSRFSTMDPRARKMAKQMDEIAGRIRSAMNIMAE